MANWLNNFLENILSRSSYNNYYIFNDIVSFSTTYTLFEIVKIKKTIDNIRQDDLVIIIIQDNKKDYKKYYEEFSKLTLLCSENTFIVNSGKESIFDTGLYKELMSLGYNLIAKSKESNSFLYIYAYNISKYKILPEWLNSDNWANPDLWEK